MVIFSQGIGIPFLLCPSCLGHEVGSLVLDRNDEEIVLVDVLRNLVRPDGLDDLVRDLGGPGGRVEHGPVGAAARRAPLRKKGWARPAGPRETNGTEQSVQFLVGLPGSLVAGVDESGGSHGVMRLS